MNCGSMRGAWFHHLKQIRMDSIKQLDSNLSKRDIYSGKAALYGTLPWVCDTDFLNFLFRDVNHGKFDFSQVIDLGCGSATVGVFVAKHFAVPYLGIEQSKEMLRQAELNLRGFAKARVINEDFTLFESRKGFHGSLIVMKNVLHLLEDYLDVVRDVVERFSGARRLLIVETVSPNPDALEWIQSLYLLLGLDYKRHWFLKGEFAQQLDTAGYKRVRNDLYPQFIDVDRWLSSFALSQETTSLAHGYFDDASSDVKLSLSIQRTENNRLRMLRLQNIIEFELM